MGPFPPLLLLTGLWACGDLPRVVDPLANRDPPIHRIAVTNHGWHTGLVVPAAELHRRVPELADRFGQPSFYELGWGDMGFYRAQEITTGLTLQAMFLATGAILQVVAVPRSAEESFPYSQVLATCVAAGELDSLLRFLADSFRRDASGHILAIAPGLYGDAQFYQATGRYHLLNNCNVWTAKALRSAGEAVAPPFPLTAAGVMSLLVEGARPCSLPQSSPSTAGP